MSDVSLTGYKSKWMFTEGTVIMVEFHAHPIEFVWLASAVLAVGGALQMLYLAISDREAAKRAMELEASIDGAVARYTMAGYNIMSETFRILISFTSLGGAVVAVVSLPAGDDFSIFPQTVGVVVAGVMSSTAIIIWCIFDIIVRRNIRINGHYA